MKKKFEIIDINGINGLSAEETTCAFTDQNCNEKEGTKPSLINMNESTSKDTTCAFTDMNCQD